MEEVLGGGRVVVLELEIEHDVGAVSERSVAQFVEQLARTEVLQYEVPATRPSRARQLDL